MEKTLRFRENGKFTIVQFTDIHWHNGEAADRRAAALMEQITTAVQPDLVVLTGDILSGGGCQDASASMRQVVRIVEQWRVPWAAVFGNHDDEGNASRRELMAMMQEGARSLAQAGPEEIPGVGNYVLPLHKADGSAHDGTALFYRFRELCTTGNRRLRMDKTGAGGLVFARVGKVYCRRRAPATCTRIFSHSTPGIRRGLGLPHLLR